MPQGGGKLRVDIEVKGYRELARKLKASDELIGGPWTGAMRQLERMLGDAWRGAIPVDTGRGRASIKTKVQAGPVPRYVLVKTTATRSSRHHKRYRYINRQEYDPKSRNKGRLTAAFERVRAGAQGILNGAARQIEAKWGA